MRTKHLFVLIYVRNKGEDGTVNIFRPFKAVLLLWIYFVICVSCLSVILSCLFPCSLVVTCWERPDLLALLYVLFSCVVVNFPYGVLGPGVVLDWIDS